MTEFGTKIIIFGLIGFGSGSFGLGVWLAG
jgi:hypothetical protein